MEDMGRISEALTSCESRRTLVFLGVEYLFAPEGSSLRELIESAKEASAQEASSFSAGGAAAKPAFPEQGQRDLPRQPEVPSASAKRAEPDGPPAASSLAEGAPKPESGDFAGQDWPEPWRGFLIKTQPHRPLLWTYPEAGLDLAGKGTKARSELIRSIISALMLPAGSSNFWPHRSGAQRNKEDESEYFLAGVRKLGPRFILVFGAEALAEIMPEVAFKEYVYVNFEGRVLLILPAMDKLANPAEREACVCFLTPFAKSLQGGS